LTTDIIQNAPLTKQGWNSKLYAEKKAPKKYTAKELFSLSSYFELGTSVFS
jgi:hypothetical protein